MWYTHKKMQELMPIPIGTKIIAKCAKSGHEYVGVLESYNTKNSWTKDKSIIIRNLDGVYGWNLLSNSKAKYKKYDDKEVIQLSLF